MKTIHHIYKETISYWWLVAIIVTLAWFGVITLAVQVFNQALPVEIGGAEEVKVMAPVSPGLASAEEACKLGKVSRIQILNNNQSAWKYFAQYGLLTVEWPDSPPGKNAIGLVDGQPVILSNKVMKCFLDHF